MRRSRGDAVGPHDADLTIAPKLALSETPDRAIASEDGWVATHSIGSFEPTLTGDRKWFDNNPELFCQVAACCLVNGICISIYTYGLRF